ncbi:MAG: hypothetical protein QM736_07890 [Vicinamibacterales bacterium]
MPPSWSPFSSEAISPICCRGACARIFATIANALVAEPFALAAFFAAFLIALLGGSVLTFLVKGGTVDVMLLANTRAGDIEHRPVTLTTVAGAAAYSIDTFLRGCSRLFRPYLRLGFSLMLVYVLTGAAYLAFIVYGYQAAGDGVLFVGWTFLAAVATLALFLWITTINLFYLLLQIAMAAGHDTLSSAIRQIVRFARAEFKELSAIFLVVLGMVVAAWLASALAWSGVGLIAFVPLVGLAVFPLQIAALVLRGLVFEYIGVTAMGAYVSLYQRFEETRR